MKTRIINIPQEEREAQKQLTQAILDGQEKERLRIGKELHDNINQHLSTTKLYMEVARENVSGKGVDMLARAYNNLDLIINEIKSLSHSLLSPVTGDLGLIESVQGYCDLLQSTHPFRIEFHHKHFNENELAEYMKLMLFRILQVQFNNIIRHANAGEVIIKLLSDAEQITLSISDNGKGFDPALYQRGSGLADIMSRTNYLNGCTEIDSLPGKGCRLTVSIPLV